jgi:hypothetical protein
MSQKPFRFSRYYAPHHFVFYPLCGLGFAACIYLAVRQHESRTIWLMLAFVFFMLTYLSLMMRQHYALMNQNRIIRLEMRFRYYVLTGQRFELLEPQLRPSQIYALRYAGDQEFPALVQRTLKEHLRAHDIRKAIVDLQPDFMRV